MKVKFTNRIYEVLFTKELAGLTMYAVEDEPNHIDWLINVEVVDADKKELKQIIDEKQVKKNLQDNSFRRTFEQKSAWSEEDEEIIKALISLCDEAQDNIPQLSALKNWLKSLKDRVQPQPKQEWSMYDETILKSLIDHFEYKKEFNEAEDYDIVLWLKSLRPQKQWELIDDNLPEFKDKLCELFQRFRWHKDEPPTNGDILEYIDTHIQELLTIVNEQKSITPKFKINDVIKYNQKQWTIIGIDINNHCYDLDNDECVDFDTADYIFELVEQKPTEWSEEDESVLNSIIEDCSYIGDYPDYPTKEEEELYDECLRKIDWLKSLKNRVQLKVEEKNKS